MTPEQALAESLKDKEEAASILYKLAELGFKIVETTFEETTPMGSTRWR